VMKLIHGLFCDRPIELCGGFIIVCVVLGMPFVYVN